MKNDYWLLVAGCWLSVLAACSEVPAGAYFNRGDPEHLLDVSQETVTVPLASAHDMKDLAGMVAGDPPSRAELGCAPGDMQCSQAKELFDRRGVPARFSGGTGGVKLIYERVVARDCQNRYIDNSINPYNLPPLTFGCSVTANTVQMVSDKRQFLNPALMDFPDSEKSTQSYRNYLKPRDTSEDGKGALSSALVPSTSSGSR